MLISCPKCYSIYEIPDNLIPETGHNFHCHKCTHQFHALRSETLGYNNNSSDKSLYIEAIDIVNAKQRNFPAEQNTYNTPIDYTTTKKQIITEDNIKETKKDIPLVDTIAQKTETIEVLQKATEEENIQDANDNINYISTRKTLSSADLLNNVANNIDENITFEHIQVDSNDLIKRSIFFRGYKKTYLLMMILLLMSLLFTFRRPIVNFIPNTEPYYNYFNLSGYDNTHFLKFQNIDIDYSSDDNIIINAEIYNNSIYKSKVPLIAVSGLKQKFAPKKDLINAKSTTSVTIIIKEGDNTSNNLTLSFSNPK